MAVMTKTWPCPRCGGEGYEDWEEDGRMVHDACYHCGTTGRVDYDIHDRTTWSPEMIAEVEREESRPKYPCSHGDPCLCWDREPDPTPEELAQWDKEYLDSLSPTELARELAYRAERTKEREAAATRAADDALLRDEMGYRPSDFSRRWNLNDDLDDPFAE